MVNESVEEISLRDVYLILKKHVRIIIGITLGAMMMMLLAALLLPKNFSSQVVMNLSVNPERSEFKAIPTAVGLSQGFIQLVNNESLASALNEDGLENIFKAKYDDKKSLLTLTAYGNTAEQALARAKRFQVVAEEYFMRQVSDTVRANLQSTLAQVKVDITSNIENLKRLEPVLSKTQGVQNDPGNAAALEAQGVDPQLARANNPALVSLALQISQLRVSLASMQARQVSLESILKNTSAFNSLLGQGFQTQVLAAPALAVQPESPKPLLMTALAAVAGLLVSLVAAFVLEALRPEGSSNTSVLTRASNQVLPRANPGD